MNLLNSAITLLRKKQQNPYSTKKEKKKCGKIKNGASEKIKIGERITDDSSIEKKIALWKILNSFQCGNCGEFNSLLTGPSGGIAINIMCNNCHQKFWLTITKELGAYYTGGDPCFYQKS